MGYVYFTKTPQIRNFAVGQLIKQAFDNQYPPGSISKMHTIFDWLFFLSLRRYVSLDSVERCIYGGGGYLYFCNGILDNLNTSVSISK